VKKILSVNHSFSYPDIEFDFIDEIEIDLVETLEQYDYILVNGGDGLLRRVVKKLYQRGYDIPIILNPQGTFNVLYHLYKLGKIDHILKKISQNDTLKEKQIEYYTINKEEIFIFSAGNSLDAIYIAISDILRMGFLKKSKLRYLFAFLSIIPLLILFIPFFLLHKKSFLFFKLNIPIKKFLQIFFTLSDLNIESNNKHYLLQLDGDLVSIISDNLQIRQEDYFRLIIG